VTGISPCASRPSETWNRRQPKPPGKDTFVPVFMSFFSCLRGMRLLR
jgi:hypothetical protein